MQLFYERRELATTIIYRLTLKHLIITAVVVLIFQVLSHQILPSVVNRIIDALAAAIMILRVYPFARDVQLSSHIRTIKLPGGVIEFEVTRRLS